MKFYLNGLFLIFIFICMFAGERSYAEFEFSPVLSYEERSRIWREGLEKRQREKRDADEEVLRDVLEKIKRFVEIDDFSIEAVERTFGLKLEEAQILESPDLKVFGPRVLYVANKADFPFSINCPEKFGNLNQNLNPVYWYQSTGYLGSSQKHVSIILFYSRNAWVDAQHLEVAKSTFKESGWRIKYVGPHHAEPTPIWDKVTEKHMYGFGFYRASDNCGAMVMNRVIR